MAKSRSKRKNPRSNHPQAINSQPIQNYIDKAVQQNLNINVIPSELNQILQKDPNYAERAMQYLENDQKHRHEIEDRILAVEEKEQSLRAQEAPQIVKFNLRGQIFATIIILSLVGSLFYSIYKDYYWIAGGSIIVTIIAILPQWFNKDRKKADPNETDRK
ncbi:DUF2335 domain-containing protein [uncultured Campylobacter sp.]|uniref:DUF2335 domain-containing protein n=2 Tax=uncultured Campylobacter sp. TaxID=218934 RepID=UPI00345B7F46